MTYFKFSSFSLTSSLILPNLISEYSIQLAKTEEAPIFTLSGSPPKTKNQYKLSSYVIPSHISSVIFSQPLHGYPLNLSAIKVSHIASLSIKFKGSVFHYV